MEYYQTEVRFPDKDQWISVSNIERSGSEIQTVASERMTHEEAEVKLEWLRATYKKLEFKIEPWAND